MQPRDNRPRARVWLGQKCQAGPMGQADKTPGAGQAVPRERVHTGKWIALHTLEDLWSHVPRGQRGPWGEGPRRPAKSRRSKQGQGWDHRMGLLVLGWLVFPALTGEEGGPGERGAGCCRNMAREGHCAHSGDGARPTVFHSLSGHHAICFRGPSIDITETMLRRCLRTHRVWWGRRPSPCTPITSTQSLHLPESCWSHLQNGIKMTTSLIVPATSWGFISP